MATVSNEPAPITPPVNHGQSAVAGRPDRRRTNDENSPLLSVHDLAVSFDSDSGPRVRAVDGVSMTIYPRQTVAVVGESGCGKSVTAMSALHLVPTPPGRCDRGRMMLQREGGARDLLTMSEREIRQIRGNEIAMIFQEPMTSLNPVYSIGDQIMEAVLLHQKVGRTEARAIAIEAMREVGIPTPEKRLKAYPHQFSGGMRQRVMIAMALACQPRLLLADEPTTALDVTIQAQILQLLRRIQRARHMGVMLITHALGVVAENADVVCVMYAGRVVEYATVLELFDHPLHPYTRGLLASIPSARSRRERLVTIREVVDDPDQFRQLPGWREGVRPWWPGHEPPADLCPGESAASDYRLKEVATDHWVGVWCTEAVNAVADRGPDLAFRLPDKEQSPG